MTHPLTLGDERMFSITARAPLFCSAYTQVDDKKKLGEWAGLCKIDADGNARKVVACSCVVVKDYGQEGEALDVLLEHLKTSNASA